MNFNLLLKGGHLIDPKNNINAPRDLAIKDGKIAAVDVDIPESQAQQVIDVKDLILTPGLVDIHTHMYATPGGPLWAGDSSILPDGFSFRSGVTTMVDTGSAGWRNFEDFRSRVLDRFRTRMYAFVNIVGMGMVDIPMEQNISDMDVDRTAAMMKEHNDVVVGAKTAHFQSPTWVSIDRALEAGRKAGVPTMIDFGFFLKERPYHELVEHRLAPGDICTHMYRWGVPWIGRDGKVLPYLYRARERGVIFDVGHGAGSFLWINAVPAVEQGFYPDSISTDLHTICMNRNMMDMVTTMSKFLTLGMQLEEVIRASTVNPAREIGHEELGHLSVGAFADVAGLNILSGDFGYTDFRGGLVRGDRRIVCELTLKDGRVEWDWNGRCGTDWRELPEPYQADVPDGTIYPSEEKTL